MDHDISTLMIGMLGLPGKDEFGAERDTKRPLLLDSVMGGKPRISDSRLLSIPAEILANIVHFIADDQPALAALALVNSDCRQLARLCQFVDICFDYSLQTFELLAALLREAATKETSRPTIGACIRRITSIFGETRESYTQEQRDELGEQATEEYLTYRSSLLMAIAAMPHLETIEWCDRFPVDADFLKLIAHSPIKHLKLSRVPIEEPYLMEPPLTPAVMQLQSLYVDTHLTLDTIEEHKVIFPFFKSLLRRCAPTLESLFWGSMDSFRTEEAISLGDEPISFPRLRQLKFGFLKLAPPALLSLFSAPLRQLTLPYCNPETTADVLTKCEPLRDLQTLVIPSIASVKLADALVGFLEEHIDLQKLCIEYCSPTVLDSQIIPLLSTGKFANLFSLSLSWSYPPTANASQLPIIATVAEESIAAIGTIVSLEQLCLAAGEKIGFRGSWAVDHEMTRANLKGLTKLKKLALCQDTYRTSDTPEVELDEAADIDNDDEDLFERAHRNRMLRQAEKYAAAMPSLEWIFCGQWPMAIEERGNGTSRVAIPLSNDRDTCQTALDRMFAMGGAGE